MKYARGASPSNRLYDSIRMLKTFEPQSEHTAAAQKMVVHMLKAVLKELNEEEAAQLAAEYKAHPERCPTCDDVLLFQEIGKKCHDGCCHSVD